MKRKTSFSPTFSANLRRVLGALSLAVGVACAEAPLVAITQIVDHPSLNAIHQGIVDELKDAGFEDGKTVRYEYESAQGNGAIAQQIAEKFVGLNPTVIVAITTPSAQAAVNTAEGKVPVIFSSVTDPVAAKLVPDLKTPVKNVTGTRDDIPLSKQLALVRSIVPEAKRFGTIYNTGDANSVATVDKLKAELESQGLSLHEVAATKSSEVLDAAQSLVGKVDAVFIGLDNTAVSALEAIIQVAEEHKLPVFSADTDSVKRGTIAALGFDYYDVGRVSGKQVVQVLQGVKPEAIPVTDVEKLNTVLNPAAAKRMGVEIPAAVLEQASELVKE